MVGKNKLKIETDKGEIIELPLIANDVKFADWCDFLECEKQSIDTHLDEKEIKQYSSEPLERMIEGLGFLVECDFTKLTENDILFMYNHFINIVRDYKPFEMGKNEYIVKIDKQEFVITKEQFSYMLNDSLTVGETIEFLEVDRFVRLKMQNAKEISNYEFNLGLEQLAILLRKRNEILPVSKSKRDAFINERKLIFQNLPLSTVLDIRAFFLRILTELSLIAVTDISLNDLKNKILAKA